MHFWKEINLQEQSPAGICKKGLVKITGKYICRTLFFNKENLKETPAQAISEKIFGTKQRNQAKLDRTKKPTFA